MTNFCIDKYEVTNAQFGEFVKARGYASSYKLLKSSRLKKV
ncbi:MAG: SUMF1/EgtB/PvdO family nonheme iron enzyme [Nostoc sp. LPT]|nr:SUMF1/EgtB/PvdO family nonheme iron enzyme [Nostoc sp. LPT]